MNICCGGKLDEEDLEFSDIEIKLKKKKKGEEEKGKEEEEKIQFDNKKGVFTYKNTTLEKEKESTIKELEEYLKKLNEKKKVYENGIEDLNIKIKNLEEILKMDMKENNYIQIIGKKTLEHKKLINNN